MHFMNSKIRDHAHRSPALLLILSQINPVEPTRRVYYEF